MLNFHRNAIAAAALALGLNLAIAQTAAPTTTPGLGGPVAGASGAMAGGTAAKLSGGDRTFVEKAAINGMAEVAMGKMAQDKGSSDAVKQFGARMVTDHTKANDELMQIASSKGVQPPADLDRKHKAESDKLSKLSGADFDRAYLKSQVAGHKDTASLLEKQSKSGRDADLKAFAAKTLPVVQDHMKMLSGMNGAKMSDAGMNGMGASATTK